MRIEMMLMCHIVVVVVLCCHLVCSETPKDDGMYELPHLTFPLFRVMDRVIVTPPGGELPQLGRELVEDEQQRKDRRAGRGDALSFKADHTYSFSFHSMYVDFSRWAICNFPGYKAIDIRGFFGQQHINVVCYEISEKDLVRVCVCEPSAVSSERSSGENTLIVHVCIVLMGFFFFFCRWQLEKPSTTTRTSATC